MPGTDQLLAFVVASAILGITPGPDLIYVMVRGAAQGAHVGVVAAAGLCNRHHRTHGIYRGGFECAAGCLNNSLHLR